jgi:REDY-like protein HapK
VATVLNVLTALKPGVDAEEYERFEREVDYPFTAKMKTIVSYRIHRLTEPAPFEGGPWNYIERIEVTDRAAYEAELATAAKELIETLHEKYLDESKLKFIWSERIDP